MGANGSLGTGLDGDNDGLTVSEEGNIGTDSCLEDTDGDSIIDGDEVNVDTDPTNPDSIGDGYRCGGVLRKSNLLPDTDQDNLTDDECFVYATDPGDDDTDDDMGLRMEMECTISVPILLIPTVMLINF